MSSRWFSMVIDAQDHRRLARWWAEVLEFHVVYEDIHKTMIADGSFPRDNFDTGARTMAQEPDAPGIVFVTAGAAHSAKGRMHLDLNPADHDAELERLMDMGARHVPRSNKQSGSTMLTDPEGNMFCVMAPIRRADMARRIER